METLEVFCLLKKKQSPTSNKGKEKKRKKRLKTIDESRKYPNNKKCFARPPYSPLKSNGVPTTASLVFLADDIFKCSLLWITEMLSVLLSVSILLSVSSRRGHFHLNNANDSYLDTTFFLSIKWSLILWNFATVTYCKVSNVVIIPRSQTKFVPMTFT